MGFLDDIGLAFKGFIDKVGPEYRSLAFSGPENSILGSMLFGGAK